MGDSGRREERVKIPLTGWEGQGCRKDVRFRRAISGNILEVEEVKLPSRFLRERAEVDRTGPEPVTRSMSANVFRMFFAKLPQSLPHNVILSGSPGACDALYER